MSYAIISLGGKQYRVQPGERLLVDRMKTDAGERFTPSVLLVGGDGKADLAPKTAVTARVVEHVLGDKIRIGKYRPKTGYRKHAGFRASLTRIEIESIGSEKAPARKGPAKEQPKKEQPTRAAAAPKPKTEEPAEQRQAEKPRAEKPQAVEATPARKAHPPKGYEEMTVAQIAEAASGWRRPNLEAALEYEREHGNRKGAIAALESALKEKH